MSIARSRLRLRVLAVVLSSGLLILPGCYGKFNITRHVHEWNGSLGGGWASEGLFILILPVYAFAMVSDALLFNLFEFWTGVNPIIPVDEEQAQRTFEDGDRLITLRSVADETSPRPALEITIAEADGATSVSRIRRTDERTAELRDAGGALIGSIQVNDDGSVTRRDSSGVETARFSKDEVASAFASSSRSVREIVLP